MKPISLLLVGIALLLPGTTKANSSWVGTPRSPGGSTQFVCETDKHGRVVRAEVYNFTIRQMIEALAVLTKVKVTIEECPDEVVSLGFQDQDFPEAMHCLLRDRGFDMVRGDTGSYRVIRITKEEPSEVGPNQRLQGAPESVPSSSTEPEARRP